MPAPESFFLAAALKAGGLWWGLAALAGYALMMATNPAREGLRDGARALRRYRGLWLVPGVFGFAAVLFQLAQRAFLFWVLPASDRPVFLWVRAAWRDREFWLTGSEESLWWLPRVDVLESLRHSLGPALDSLAGIFNSLTATFPLSAVAALLLVLNRGGHHAMLLRALRKRFGHGAWAIHAGIMLCAAAAMAKPFLYVAPLLFRFSPAMAEAWFQWAPVVAWLSFLFEYLFGVFLQTCLILLAYAWLRGTGVSRERLAEFAIRRFSLVVKWAGVILVLSSLCIDGPLILKNFAPFAAWFPEEALFGRYLAIARAVLAVAILLGASVQITLVFHSESLAAAWRDHVRFVRGHWWTLLWFLAVAGVHCYALAAAGALVGRGLGEGTAPWVLWSLMLPWLAALVLGWLLASWVCIYKHRDTPHLSAATQRLFDF